MCKNAFMYIHLGSRDVLNNWTTDNLDHVINVLVLALCGQWDRWKVFVTGGLLQYTRRPAL